MNKLEIRSYTKSDLESVKNLHRVALEATSAYIKSGIWDNDLQNIEGVYFENNGVFLVGLLDSQIAAMGALRKVSSEKGEIKRMRVLPQFQGNGFGQAMLDVLEIEALERGYKVLCLDTTVVQVVAQKMYLKNGYIEIRRTKLGFPLETIFYEKNLVLLTLNKR